MLQKLPARGSLPVISSWLPKLSTGHQVLNLWLWTAFDLQSEQTPKIPRQYWAAPNQARRSLKCWRKILEGSKFQQDNLWERSIDLCMVITGWWGSYRQNMRDVRGVWQIRCNDRGECGEELCPKYAMRDLKFCIINAPSSKSKLSLIAGTPCLTSKNPVHRGFRLAVPDIRIRRAVLALYGTNQREQHKIQLHTKFEACRTALASVADDLVLGSISSVRVQPADLLDTFAFRKTGFSWSKNCFYYSEIRLVGWKIVFKMCIWTFISFSHLQPFFLLESPTHTSAIDHTSDV